MVEDTKLNEQVTEQVPNVAVTGPAQVKTETPTTEEPGLTQAQVNALMGRTRKEAKVALLKELGFDDAEALKATLSRIREQEDAQKTEAEKLTQKLSQLQSENARLAQEHLNTLIRMAVANKAVKLGFQDPEDAYHMIDLSALQVEEDGSVKGADDALQALAKSKPYLLKTQPQMGPTNMPRGGQVGETDVDRRHRLFGGGQSALGTAGGGVFMPKTE